MTGLDCFVFYVVSGLVFTTIYLWRRNLYPGMVVHTLVNLPSSPAEPLVNAFRPLIHVLVI